MQGLFDLLVPLRFLKSIGASVDLCRDRLEVRPFWREGDYRVQAVISLETAGVTREQLATAAASCADVSGAVMACVGVALAPAGESASSVVGPGGDSQPRQTVRLDAALDQVEWVRGAEV